MYLFMISLLLFCNIITKSTCYEEIPSRRINAEAIKNDKENCQCFPGGRSLIPELSNFKANGLERLVVYLYKNEHTNEVYVFQPSAEKQPLIPDIPYTSGDLLKPVTTETIGSLFSNNPNKPRSHQHVDTKGEPIGLNTGIVNHVSRPPWSFTGFPERTDRNVPNRNKFSNREYVVPSLSPHLEWYPNQKQQHVHTQIKANQQQPFKKSVFEPIGIKHNIIRPLIKPIKSTDFDDGSVQTYNIIGTHPEKKTWPFKEEKYIIPLNPYRNKAYHIHEAEVNLPQRLSTFDDWFREQMATVQNQKISKGVNKIDSDSLRPLVLKTLLDNHFHLSDKGIMIDDSGTPMDLNNLELRPILIGSAVKFQSLDLIQQITFPETLPYLQGILIIQIQPFKILGVMPVGKTYVSSPGKVKNPSLKPIETVESFAKIPLHSQPTRIATNPFKLLERPVAPVSSVPSVFSMNQKLPKKIVLKPLDSEVIKSSNFAVDKPFTFNNNGRWNTLTNSRLDYQRPGGQFNHLKVSPIKNNLNFKNNWSLVSDSGHKQYSSFDIFAPGNGNPHLTAIPLRNKVESHLTQSNRNAQNINAVPINSHIGVTSNSFWNHFHSKNPLPKSDSSSHHFIYTPITRISESPFESGRSNPKLVVNPLSEDLRSSPSQKYSPGFNSKYFTAGPDIADSHTWGSFSNTGSGYSNRNPNIQHPHPQESSWFSDGWGDAIMKSIPSVLNSEVTGIEIPNWNNLDDTQNHPLAEDDSLLGPTRRFSSPVFKGVLKTLIQIIIENLVNKKNQEDNPEKEDDGTKTSAVKVNTTVGKHNALREAGNDEDDGPDYRIIGGSAATGSGSPLSNKGRSGLSIS